MSGPALLPTYQVTVVLPTVVVTAVVTAAVVIWGIVRHYDRIELVLSRLAKWFAWFSKRAERASVALDLQARCETLAKTINTEAPGALAYGLKVEWVRETTQEAFIKEGKVVVRLDHHRNQARNLVLAIVTFLPNALLPQARSYINPASLSALDLTVARKVILPYGSNALTYFVQEVLEPACAKSKDVQITCGNLEALDDFGLLARVLLRQYLDLGTALFPRVTSDEVRAETKDLIDFLATIAEREHGEEVPLEFKGKYVSLGFVMVARPETFAAFGVAAYTRRIMILVRQGIRNIYLTGWGRNVSAVKSVMAAITSVPGLDKVSEAYYTMRDRDFTWRAIIVGYRNNVSLETPSVKELERKLRAVFFSSLITDLLTLEAKTGIDDLKTLEALVARNPFYDSRTYQKPNRAVQELQTLGILVPDGARFRVNKENDYVRVALDYLRRPGEKR